MEPCLRQPSWVRITTVKQTKLPLLMNSTRLTFLSDFTVFKIIVLTVNTGKTAQLVMFLQLKQL